MSVHPSIQPGLRAIQPCLKSVWLAGPQAKGGLTKNLFPIYETSSPIGAAAQKVAYLFPFPLPQVLRDKKGDIIEGDPEKILRVTYVMALCRDQEILDPSACWRLLDLSASSATQWL